MFGGGGVHVGTGSRSSAALPIEGCLTQAVASETQAGRARVLLSLRHQ